MNFSDTQQFLETFNCANKRVTLYRISGHWSNEYSVHQGSERPGFNPRSIHTTDSKMVLASALLNTQYYKVKIKGKVEQSREWSSVLPLHSVVEIEKGAFGSPSTMVANLLLVILETI